MPARAFGIASLESGLSYVLEVTYGWEMTRVGAATSFTFISCVFLKIAYDQFKSALTIGSWLRIWVWLSLVGVLMLHPKVSYSAHMLLLACVITFPTLYMSGGLISGIMQNHCLPAGSFLDTNTSIFLSEMGANILGRCGGAPLARWALKQGGQQQYFVQQTATCALAVILTEIVLRFQIEDYRAKCLHAERAEKSEGHSGSPPLVSSRPAGA